MGRFRIGEPTGNKKQILESRPARQVLQNIIEKADTSEIEKALAELTNKVNNLPVLEAKSVETVIQKVETVKEIYSVKTKDSRSRKYAKILRRLLEIQAMRNDAQDDRDDGQDIEIAKQKHAIKKINQQILELQESVKMLESNILKEIQVVKDDNSLKYVVLGLIISVGLNIAVLILK